jgi:hypothetical protein
LPSANPAAAAIPVLKKFRLPMRAGEKYFAMSGLLCFEGRRFEFVERFQNCVRSKEMAADSASAHGDIGITLCAWPVNDVAPCLLDD